LPGRPAVRYLLSTGPMPSTGRHVHVELVGCSLVAITGLRGLDGPAVAALSCSPPGALPGGRRGAEPRQGEGTEKATSRHEAHGPGRPAPAGITGHPARAGGDVMRRPGRSYSLLFAACLVVGLVGISLTPGSSAPKTGGKVRMSLADSDVTSF